MTNKEFYNLYLEAIKEPKKNIFISCNTSIEAEKCSKIWDIAHLDMRAIINMLGISQREFAERYFIPLRTVESWVASSVKESRNYPEYIKLLILKDLGILDDIL